MCSQIAILYARIIPPSVVPAPEQQLTLGLAGAEDDGDTPASSPRPSCIGWAKLLARVFALDVTSRPTPLVARAAEEIFSAR